MSISLYFGLPRCGKTTFYAKIAYDNCSKIRDGLSPYKLVYGNIHLDLGELNRYYRYIKTEWLGVYEIEYGLVLIDEGSLCFDNRDYKSLSPENKEFFLEHGHYHCDIIFFNQQWDALDKKIRVITNEVYYVRKEGLWGRWFSFAMPIPYGVIIPDGKSDTEKLGEIVQGYCKPKLRVLLTQGKLCRRAKYYKYFDSWTHPTLPPLPSE